MCKLIALACMSLLLLVVAHAGAQPATQPAVASTDAFPFTIKFEQGVAQFETGDRITITEVRGTSSDMHSGICRICGTYRLASQETATLAAFVTDRGSGSGPTPVNGAQRMMITKGSGSFTLTLPVSSNGWPHVSFYGASGSFGGSYIGTGDLVLRRWWGSQ